MPTQKKIQMVEELTNEFKDSALIVAAQYRGLTVAQMTGLRAALRNSGSHFRVSKNTLGRIAADNAGKPHVKEILEGPVGLLTSSGDPAAAARALVDYVTENRLEAVKIVGGALDGTLLSGDRVEELAKLPSREEMVSRLLGQMNAPIAGLVTVLSGPVRALATVLQRYVEKQQEGAPAGA